MRTDKNISIGLIIISSVLFAIGAGLFIWAGFDSIETAGVQLWSKVGCGIFVILIGIGMLIFGLKITKPTKK